MEIDVARRWLSPSTALAYASRHERSRFRDRLEHRAAARALRPYGAVWSILDCPAGTGRFWGLLAGASRELHAVDASPAMLGQGRSRWRGDRVAACVARAEHLPFASDSVDVVFCSRLLHHLPTSGQRIRVLSELRRVSRQGVVFSAWVSGGLRGPSRSRSGPATRFVVPLRLLREEAELAGLRPVAVAFKWRVLSPVVFISTRKD